ncbi:MAG: insulinase family protein, partial [Holophagales bacterium]|nr:insulinase family protein [Holophagales bacterium]
AFNGTESFEKHELVDYLQGIGMRFGADVNATTGFDETRYMLTVPTDDPDILETAFEILGEWAGRVTFDPEEVEKERGVVVGEWRRIQGAGMRLTDRQLPVIFAGSHYVDRLPIGTKESVEASPPEALVRYYRDWYRPSLMAVTAAGDFDLDQVEGWIGEHLGFLEDPEDPRPRPESFEVPEHDAPLFSIETDPELTNTQVSVLFKRRAEPRGTVGQYRRGLVENLHAQMLNARLAELAQSADPPFVVAFAGNSSLVRGKSVYQLDAIVPDGETERGLRAVLEEVERADRHGFTEGELERAKNDIGRSYQRIFQEKDQQPSAAFAEEYVRAFLTDEPIPGIEAEVAMAERFLPEIGLDEVNALGSRFITEKNRVILVSAPESEIAPPAEEALMAVFRGVGERQLEPWVDRTRDEPLIAEAPQGGPVVESSENGELGLTVWKLPNGVRVVAKPTDFKNDQVLFTAWSPGGSSLVADEDFTSASFAPFLLGQGGVGDFDLVELQKALAGKVVSSSPFIEELEEGISGQASPRDLETLFQLIHLQLTRPRLDLDAYSNLMGRMRAMVENRSKNPGVVFRDAIQESLSQGHYRRRPLTPEVLDELEPERALAIYRDRFADTSDFTFLFVGAFEVEQLRPLAETYLASLPATRREETWRDIGVQAPREVERLEVRKGLEPKATVSLTYHGDGEWTRERRFQMLALTRVLEIQLRELLREEMGATYSVGVSGRVDRWPEAYFDLSVGFTCNPEEVDPILEKLFTELDDVRENGPDPDTVAKVRENLQREREVSLRENSFWLGILSSYLRNDLDLGMIHRYGELLAGLEPELVQDAARHYLIDDRYLLGVLLPEEGATSQGVAAGASAEPGGSR